MPYLPGFSGQFPLQTPKSNVRSAIATQTDIFNCEDGKITFQFSSHPDMKVVVGGKEFPCHSIALHAYSHYFDSLKRPRETIHCVKLPQVSSLHSQGPINYHKFTDLHEA